MKVLVMDFSRVLIFADDMSVPSFGKYYRQLVAKPDFNFDAHFFLNIELLDWLRDYAAMAPVYVFSDGGMYKLDEVKPRITGIFKRIFSAEEFGATKSDVISYQKLAAELGCEPKDIVFVDDKPANFHAAKAAGCQALLYQDNAGALAFLRHQFAEHS